QIVEDSACLRQRTAIRHRERQTMKRKSLFALSAVVVVAAAALVPVLWSGSDYLHNGAAMAATPADQAAMIKRGEYLARAGDCIACHTVRGGKQFAGGLPMATPFGTMFTPNITPDDEYGIGKWTADDFYRAMHTGRSKDGSLLYPGFPFTRYKKILAAPHGRAREQSSRVWTPC